MRGSMWLWGFGMKSDSASLDEPVRLKVRVVPGASRSAIFGWLDDVLKVRVSAQPEKGKANTAVVMLLSGRLGLPKSSLHISSGKTSPNKVIEIHGLSIAEVMRKLDADSA